MIVVENLSRRFGKVQALADVSFEVRDGAITGLLGHNGAGKSTTLRILSTVIKADAGKASVDGFDCATQSLAVRRSLGELPHGSRGLRRPDARTARAVSQIQPHDHSSVAVASHHTCAAKYSGHASSAGSGPGRRFRAKADGVHTSDSRRPVSTPPPGAE